MSKVAYIISFSINLIFLARLQNRDIKWNHVTENISCRKITKIIDHIFCHSNNYQISEKSSSNVFYNSFSIFVSMKIVDSTAFANVWHHQMNHLKPFGLHHLNKKCLGVRLKGLNMSQCDVCAKAKMTNQVFHRPPINRPTRPFYKVNIDWEDLDEGWNNYQSDGTIIKRIMKIICQIINMMITYFILIRKKNENLSFIQNLIIWTSFRYNFNIKIIRSDHEMNHNCIRQYLTNIGIIFEPSSANTQTQNGVAKRFERTMMTKTKIMWLFINLPHSIWKKIIEAATYLYNRTLKTALEWKSPYKAFHIYVWRKEIITGFQKPQIHHFQTYGCKCYVLIKFQNDFRKADKL